MDYGNMVKCGRIPKVVAQMPVTGYIRWLNLGIPGVEFPISVH